MRPPALVLFNPAAHGAQGTDRLERVRPAIDAVCRPTVCTLEHGSDWEGAIAAALEEGTRFFIAAGGDGTVNALVNGLERARGDVPFEAILLGAVGLGSSNDFHKPARREVEGIPVRLDAGAAVPRDLIACRWDGGQALGVVSASIGVTASANAFFNRGDPVVEALKKRFTGAAIAWAAARTVVRFRGVWGRVDLPGVGAEEVRLNNLSVLQTEWLSGSLRFDTPVDPGDGHLQVNLLEGRTRLGTLWVLLQLVRGRFAGLRGTHCQRVRSVGIELTEPAELELDGELHRARSIHFTVHSERISTCP